jgi:DNA-binding response OmpR family regulator
MTLALLIVEDDAAIATAVAFAARMTWSACRVTVATSGREALDRFAAEQPDLVVLDVELPPPDGFELCRRIRAVSPVPILMLTVRAHTLDKVRALDLGADDYLTKPFDHLELLARLRALLRRTQDLADSGGAVLTVGDVTLDRARHELRVRGTTQRLTTTETRLLAELLRHAGRVLPPHYLLERVWGPEYTMEGHYLKVVIRRLRQKLGDDAAHPRYIQTERGAGYRFVPPR